MWGLTHPPIVTLVIMCWFGCSLSLLSHEAVITLITLEIEKNEIDYN